MTRNEAKRVLGILQRNLSTCDRAIKEQAYISLVRPIAEYATTAWWPYTAKDTHCVEAVQRCATHIVANDYWRSSSVTAVLESLGWESLEARRRTMDLTLFYKIQYGHVGITLPPEVALAMLKPGGTILNTGR